MEDTATNVRIHDLPPRIPNVVVADHMKQYGNVVSVARELKIGSGGQRKDAPGGNQEARASDLRIPLSSASHQSLEMLKGREDYAAWAFGMRMVMIKEGT